MTTFEDLVRNQFEYGGKKYALAGSNTRESTDILCERHGMNGLYWCMDKYTFRFKNLQREKDILKIACYCYILWLKKGFFIKETGLKDIIDTNIVMKIAYFPKFLEFIQKYKEDFKELILAQDKISIEELLNRISTKLSIFSQEGWDYVTLNNIFWVYYACEAIWERLFKDKAVHDEDTYNETKNGK